MKCIHCKKELTGASKKYCDNICQGDWTYYNVHFQLILEGKKNFWSRPLRRYVFERADYKCQVCDQGDTWCDGPLTLQVDHIDGNSDNNWVDNLRCICPNCHSQTPTYGAKGHGNTRKKNTKSNKYLREYKS